MDRTLCIVWYCFYSSFGFFTCHFPSSLLVFALFYLYFPFWLILGIIAVFVHAYSPPNFLFLFFSCLFFSFHFFFYILRLFLCKIHTNKLNKAFSTFHQKEKKMSPFLFFSLVSFRFFMLLLLFRPYFHSGKNIFFSLDFTIFSLVAFGAFLVICSFCVFISSVM